MRIGIFGMGLLLMGCACGCEEKDKTPVASPAPSATGPFTASSTSAATAAPTASASATPTVSAAAARPATVIAQHILVAYRGAKRAPKGVTRSKAEAKARADEVVAKLKAGEDFATLVKTYSDDQGSVDRQGSVGKFAPGDMDPAFSATAFGLTVSPMPGSDSLPVETPFGFHVIRRTQ